MRTAVEPSPCGTTAPPSFGACILSNSSRSAFLLFGFRLELLLAFFPNAPPAPPRCGGRPPPGRAGAPVAGAPTPDGPLERYGPEEVGAPAPVLGGKFPVPAPAGRGEFGRAAKPGRTEPGRGPDMPGRGAPAAGRAGGRGPAPPVENGLFPGRGGCGTAPPEENGLFPGRGAAGVAGFGAAGVSATGATESVSCAVGRSILLSAIARSCAAFSAARSTPSSAANSAANSGFASPFLAAVFFAAAFLTGLASSFGLASGYNATSLRTTGASTVDDADRTNSPNSWSFASTSLLSMPNCFANSCTRTFATVLLSWPARLMRCEP